MHVFASVYIYMLQCLIWLCMDGWMDSIERSIDSVVVVRSSYVLATCIHATGISHACSSFHRHEHSAMA
uniref:Secreted protein n=1 Tax=Oryza brachyantha TaxID=4533 RepID=J3MU83_ORYBR